MIKVNRLLVSGSILGIFLLVYGTAIVFRLLMGNYFLSGGLADPNYIFLALLCAIPFVVGSLIKTNKNIETIYIGGILFSLLFITVHGALVFSAMDMTDDILVRTLIVFPISGLLVIWAVYFGMNRGRPYSES